jgi:hypothetical protein
MQGLGDARRHFFLTLARARAHGVDLGEALREGLISRQDYADTITRCRSCTAPDICARWIDSLQGGAEAPDLPPAFCRNADLLAELGRF